MNYYILLSTIALFGCVGSVEEARKDLTESVEETKQSDLSFNGIHSLIPIANDKIEVYFFPASGGSKEYTYLIYVGNQPQPVSINEENMRKDYRGLFVYTLHGLSVGTNYVVKVDVKDRENEDVFVTESSMSTFTFRNEVADFFGVSSLSNLGGYEGVDSISVRWPHATIFPGNILGSDRDPIAYEITLLDSSRLTPAAFNDFSLGFSDGKITKTVNYDPLVNTNIVRSLEEDKLYYVNVRAIHRGTVNDPNNPRLRSDLNNKYFEIKTLSQNSSEIEYTLDDYFLTGTSGSSMMTSLSMNWGSVVGVFDHLRVYYSVAPNLVVDTLAACQLKSSSELLGGQVGCKKLLYNSVGTILTDLAPNKNYDARLVVCLDTDCTDSINLPVLSRSTGAVLTGFSGITKIAPASRVEDLGKLDLFFNAPNFSEGYFHGLEIEFTMQKSQLLSWVNDPTFPKPQTYFLTDPAYTGELTVNSFNYLWDTKITIEGVDYSSVQDYCFAVYPFSYDANGNKILHDEGAVWSCQATNVVRPSKTDFEGFDSGNTVNNDVYLFWKEPLSGVYTHFEIFVKKVTANDVSFSFNDAIIDTTQNYDFSTYTRYLFNKDLGPDSNGEPVTKSGHIFANLSDGYYIFGVSTYINMGFVVRGEENAGLLKCHVLSGSVNDCSFI